MKGNVVYLSFLLFYRVEFMSAFSDCREKLPRAVDYIIVGGGTAGCVLANRLSEDQDVTVLLIEAGTSDVDQPETALMQTPFLIGTLLKSKVSWQYPTVPQKNVFFGAKDKVGLVEMGKVLGGSSSHNGMGFTRGHRFDFEYWAANGATGWNFSDVLPYFKKVEDIRVPKFEQSELRGKCGPVPITEASTRTDFTDIVLNATSELGIRNVDCNSDNPIGICTLQINVRSGVRASTASEYLRPVLGRHNLHVLTETFVTKIHITKRTKKASGVQYVHKGLVHNVRSRQEVILSAGSFRSPQLLMLSGIGPKWHLNQLGIRSIMNLPVGYNLHDRLSVFVGFDQDIPPFSFANMTSPETVSQYLFKREGPYATRGEILYMHFKTPPSKPTPWPDTAAIISNGARVTALRFDENIFEDEEKRDLLLPGGLRTTLGILHPTSRGTVRLKSRRPMEFPLIDPKYLSTEQDIKENIKGIRFMQTFLKTSAFKRVNSRLEKPIPECSNTQFNSDAYWKCYIQYRGRTAWHPVGTCKMGSIMDRSTVVDPELRVKGVKYLRVADASIAPEITSGRTMAMAMMIGEKASDMIKQDRIRRYK